jgi:formate/nitrite transporter FocA (FNT family)
VSEKIAEEEPVAVPNLTEKEKQEAEKRSSISASIVHEAVRKQGEDELARPVSALAWSGLAAGLSMGFSFLAEAILHSYAPGQPLISKFGYAVGFLLVIIGRQQLFTENTLTPIIPLLARRNMATFWVVLRLWIVVLAANLAGAHIFAWVVANTNAVAPEFHNAMDTVAANAGNVSFHEALVRGIFAGWLIALMVWMLPAVEHGRIWVVIILTYIVAIGSFTHIIAGSVEVLYLVMIGARSWSSFALGYMAPTFIGNIVGGVTLVAALNHAQVVSGLQAEEA